MPTGSQFTAKAGLRTIASTVPLLLLAACGLVVDRRVSLDVDPDQALTALDSVLVHVGANRYASQGLGIDLESGEEELASWTRLWSRPTANFSLEVTLGVPEDGTSCAKCQVVVAYEVRANYPGTRAPAELDSVAAWLDGIIRSIEHDE
jgi:hypothetical protein